MQNWEEGRSGVVVCGGGALTCQCRFDRGERAGQQRNRSNQPKPRMVERRERAATSPRTHPSKPVQAQTAQCQSPAQAQKEQRSTAQRTNGAETEDGEGGRGTGNTCRMDVRGFKKWPYCNVRTMHGTYKAAVAGEGCRFLACPAVGRWMNPAFFFFLLRLFTTHSLDFSQLYFVLSPNRGGDEGEASKKRWGREGQRLVVEHAAPAGRQSA